jgi:hypothetical protein
MDLSSHYGKIVAVFGGTFAVAYLITRAVRGDGKKYLPSLPHVPIFGSLPFMPNAEDLPQFFMEKAKSLGKVFAFYMGPR